MKACAGGSVVLRGTVTGDLLPLALQVLGAGCFEGRESTKLPEAIEEGLLLLLSVGCQNLLGQAQLLVRLPLLTGRTHCRGRRRASVLARFRRVSGSCNVLYDFCKDEREGQPLTCCKPIAQGV